MKYYFLTKNYYNIITRDGRLRVLKCVIFFVVNVELFEIAQYAVNADWFVAS